MCYCKKLNMKRINLILLFVIVTLSLSAQEKGSFLGITLGGGMTGFNYELEGINAGGKNQFQLGGVGKLEYSYFFNKNLGISLGAGLSYYRTMGKYQGLESANYFDLGPQIDDDPLIGSYNDYNLRVRLLNWEEQQSGYIIDVPLMFKTQVKFGKKKRHGMYFGIGPKLQIPVKSSYKILDGEYSDMDNPDNWRLNVSGYYPGPNLEIGATGDPSASQHGFGTITDPHAKLNWEGDNQLKLSWSGTAELGFLFGLSQRVDLVVGAYFDYGFNNIKKQSKVLLEAPESYTSTANTTVGNGIKYNGMMNSDRIDKVNLMSYGAQLGLKIKLGKLSEKDPVSDYDRRNQQVIIIEKDTCCEKPDNKGVEDALNRIESIMKDFLENQTPRAGNNNYTVLEGQKMLVVGNDTIYVGCDQLPEEQSKIMMDHVYFDLNSYVLRTDQLGVLNKKITVMKENPDIKLRIIGNTCDLGNGINIMLGLNRAEAVKKYMENNGIPENRLVTATQGKNDPMVPNNSEDNRKLNRRCDFEVIFK